MLLRSSCGSRLSFACQFLSREERARMLARRASACPSTGAHWRLAMLAAAQSARSRNVTLAARVAGATSLREGTYGRFHVDGLRRPTFFLVSICGLSLRRASARRVAWPLINERKPVMTLFKRFSALFLATLLVAACAGTSKQEST